MTISYAFFCPGISGEPAGHAGDCIKHPPHAGGQKQGHTAKVTHAVHLVSRLLCVVLLLWSAEVQSQCVRE